MNLLLIVFLGLVLLLFLAVVVYAMAGLGLIKPLVPFLPINWKTGPAVPKQHSRKWWQTFLYIALLVLFSRLVICLIAYLAIVIERGPQFGGFFQYFVDTFIKPGDTPHYLKIAQYWYARSGDDAKYIVFYPLYPICIMFVNLLVRNYFLAGLLVSNLCLIVACYYLYRLVGIDYQEITARQAVIFLLLYPFSVFLIGVFTESLFIMLSLMIFYYMRRQKWLITGMLGFLASMTRTQGMLLIIPVLYEYALVNKLFRGFRLNRAKIFDAVKKLKPDFLFILLMPLGFGVYLAINKIVQGDWFIFYKHISAPPWWQGQNWIGNNLYQHYDMSQKYYSLGLIIYKVQIAEFFIFCGLVLYGMWKRIRTSYLIYMLAYLMFTYTSSWMISGPRYMMADIPLYIVLAAAAEKRVTQAAFLIFLGLLCILYTILFFQGQAIM